MNNKINQKVKEILKTFAWLHVYQVTSTIYEKGNFLQNSMLTLV